MTTMTTMTLKPHRLRHALRRQAPRLLLYILVLVIPTLLLLPPAPFPQTTIHLTHPSSSTPSQPHLATNHLQDPCSPYETPPPPSPEKTSRPPTLFFLHLPKTGGTTLNRLITLDYARKTKGMPCNFATDGTRGGSDRYLLYEDPKKLVYDDALTQQLIYAHMVSNRRLKEEVYRKGGCRSVRGHVSYKLYNDIEIDNKMMITVMRDPVERFVSMYWFALGMAKDKPGITGWDGMLSGDLGKDLMSGKGVLNWGFVDGAGRWLERGRRRFSFFFYGILHAVSGQVPRFAGVEDVERFRVVNDGEMAEVAKMNLCRAKVVGIQEDFEKTLDLVFKELEPWVVWEETEKKKFYRSKLNVSKGKKSRMLKPEVRKEIERRLEKEIEVYQFAQRVFEYRYRLAFPEGGRNNTDVARESFRTTSNWHDASIG